MSCFGDFCLLLPLLSFELQRNCFLQRAAEGHRGDAVDALKASAFT